MLSFFKGLLAGNPSGKFVRAHQNVVAAVNAMEPDMAKKSDAELGELTGELRAKLDDGCRLDDLVVPAFAAVREAAKRALGLRAFDTQLLGALALHQGRIAEMKTGEGKTLVATFAAYLNALPGKGVHIVTVNDYLAKRDAAWMGQVFARLGMQTAAVYHELEGAERQAAYRADITYATNNELGFDYLRDNMALSPYTQVQRPLHYAIVDEVDSILVDEARTPLIISGPTDDKTELYKTLDALVPTLVETTDYEIDIKQKQVHLLDAGIDKTEDFLRAGGMLDAAGNLYDVHNLALVHHTMQALRAHTLFRKDVDYVVKNDEVVLIDEFTGRMTPGRRLSEGLHQAIEAKEQVTIKPENQTLASITFQNYFRLYPKLAGMTGTAATEAEEFGEIYNLAVTTMPTHVPVARVDAADQIFLNKQGKLDAIAADIKDCHGRGQPVLVGTVSIEQSEELSAALAAAKVPHQVLNARYHEQEAGIIAQAGRKGAVTVATNMAGRGTDIKLGGNIELLLEGVESDAEKAKITQAHEAEKAAVMAAGGLRVIGTERHESRRIDNQLRGRSGRQGDVGSSQFYLSLQDDLMRRFAPNLDALMQRLSMPENEAVQHTWLNKSIETAQRKIENMHFDYRKNVLKYDDILNEQRKVIYAQRQHMLGQNNLVDDVTAMRDEVAKGLLDAAMPPETMPEQWQPQLLVEGMQRYFGLNLPIMEWLAADDVSVDEVEAKVLANVQAAWQQKVASMPPDVMASICRTVILQVLDAKWRQHLQALDWLRKGIGLRATAQKDPLNEYSRESFMLFDEMLTGIRQEVVGMMSHVQLVREDAAPAPVAGPVDATPTEASRPKKLLPAKGAGKLPSKVKAQTKKR